MIQNKLSNGVNKKIILSLLFIFIISSGFGCTKNPLVKKDVVLRPVSIEIWGVHENENNLSLLIDAFKKIHPTVTIKYKKFTPQEFTNGYYEDQLISEWAKDKGPDAYFIPNNYIAKFKDFITPLPAKVKLPFREIKTSKIGYFSKTDVINYTKDLPTTSLKKLISNYPEVIYDDVVINNQIHGLPLSLETIGLFYNRDIFNNANIAQAPKSWEEFNAAVKKITQLNSDNKFIQSGTALGTTNNIDNASELLMLLMMQNGGDIVSSNKRINFNDYQKISQAISFYNDFSNPIKEVYSWDESQNNSFDAFKAGQLAMFFGLPYHIDEIKKSAPALNFGIAPVPQVNKSNPVNIANYWNLVVSHKSKNSDIAWGFIDFATQEKNVKIYLENSQRPTALRTLQNDSSQNNLNTEPFANQILSARSWYHGLSPEIAKNYLKEMSNYIKNNSLKPSDLEDVLENTAIKINQTIN
ncbi:extracellular solute-binding protein [bacterium]|nr:extracellular solute-binding protein [bacterium]